jgi:hypothetical protein
VPFFNTESCEIRRHLITSTLPLCAIFLVPVWVCCIEPLVLFCSSPLARACSSARNSVGCTGRDVTVTVKVYGHDMYVSTSQKSEGHNFELSSPVPCANTCVAAANFPEVLYCKVKERFSRKEGGKKVLNHKLCGDVKSGMKSKEGYWDMIEQIKVKSSAVRNVTLGASVAHGCPLACSWTSTIVASSHYAFYAFYACCVLCVVDLFSAILQDVGSDVPSARAPDCGKWIHHA